MTTEDWARLGLCRGQSWAWEVPDMTRENSVELSGKHRMILLMAADRCLDCPVFFQCEEDAEKYGDFGNVVRAGRMPEDFFQQERGRPRKSTSAARAKAPLANARLSMLDRGVCPKGLHSIGSKKDIHNGSCRKCGYEARIAGDARRAQALVDRGWCMKGRHQILSIGDTAHGTCKACSNVHQAERRKIRNRVK